ncbi:MAG: histidine phosphatase family protein [Deltaproteobacteria bacterium]|nr:histidine phosphatase family protein [Deltaproteobacteria bacterium]
MANQLILIRHGDLGNRYRGRYVGRTDAPLSAETVRRSLRMDEIYKIMGI